MLKLIEDYTYRISLNDEEVLYCILSIFLTYVDGFIV